MDTESNLLDMLPDILNPRMIAGFLDIGYAKALELVKSGEIPCLKIGNSYKIPKAAFVTWLNEPGLRKVL